MGYPRDCAGTWLRQHIPKSSEEGMEDRIVDFTDHTHTNIGNKEGRTPAMAQPNIHTAHCLLYNSYLNQSVREEQG